MVECRRGCRRAWPRRRRRASCSPRPVDPEYSPSVRSYSYYSPPVRSYSYYSPPVRSYSYYQPPVRSYSYYSPPVRSFCIIRLYYKIETSSCFRMHTYIIEQVKRNFFLINVCFLSINKTLLNQIIDLYTQTFNKDINNK